MIKNYHTYFFICIITSTIVIAKTNPQRVQGWLELDTIKQKMQANIKKYQELDATIKEETSQLLTESINSADTLAQKDPVAAYALYHEMQKLKNQTITTSLDIEKINKRFQEISDYVDQQVLELREIRRKHIQFPN